MINNENKNHQTRIANLGSTDSILQNIDNNDVQESLDRTWYVIYINIHIPYTMYIYICVCVCVCVCVQVDVMINTHGKHLINVVKPVPYTVPGFAGFDTS